MRGRVRVDLRLVGAGVLAAAVAIAVSIATAPDARSPVLVAGSDLPEGVAFEELDVSVRNVIDPTGLVDAEDAGQVAGRSLRAPLAAGEPIPRSLLVDEESNSIAVVGLELESSAALHGRLRPGDRVDVYRVDDGSARLVAGEVQVLMVEVDGGALGLGGVRLLVAVEHGAAGDLVAAGDSVQLIGSA